MGADVNAAATGGVTPLHVAAEVGLKDVVQILLKVGGRQFLTSISEVPFSKYPLIPPNMPSPVVLVSPPHELYGLIPWVFMLPIVLLCIISREEPIQTPRSRT